VLERGYSPFTLRDAVSVGGKRVVVTFDDGFKSVAELAAPILEELCVPATVFVVTAAPSGGRPLDWPALRRWLGPGDEAEIMPLDWSELRALRDVGWEIASHTETHPHLTRIPPEQLARELVNSKDRISQEVGDCTSFCAPFGEVNISIIDAIGKAGYTFACNSIRGFPEINLNLPRVAISHVDGMRIFSLKTSPVVRRLRSSRSWTIAKPIISAYTRARERGSAL